MLNLQQCVSVRERVGAAGCAGPFAFWCEITSSAVVRTLAMDKYPGSVWEAILFQECSQLLLTFSNERLFAFCRCLPSP